MLGEAIWLSQLLLLCGIRESLANPSICARIESMLLPRFTLRRLLLFMVGCAAFCWVVAAGFKGQTWAIAFSAGVASLGFMLLLHSMTYLVAWWISLVTDLFRPSSKRQSPFAEGSMPPQLIPPQEPE